jgi:uncharacterized protein involved in exopolysaccharide biosynthesis
MPTPPALTVLPPLGPAITGAPGAEPAAQAWRVRAPLLGAAVVFLVACAASLVYVFARPPVYRSTAVLAVAGAPEAGALGQPAMSGTQAEIERQRLLAHEVLERVLARSAEATEPASGGAMPRTVPELRRALEATPVAETGLLRLAAEGRTPDGLPELLQAWIDEYLHTRNSAEQAAMGHSAETVREQAASLEQQVADKRGDLERFRQQHDIVSLERDGNRALKQVKSLNDALDRATEAEAAARARLSAVREAVANGEPVPRPREDTALVNLEGRASELREQLAALEDQYTQTYMGIHPEVQALRKRLAQVEERIRQRRVDSAAAAIAEAEQNAASAAETLARLRQKLDEEKQKAALFESRFAEHQALGQELADLEGRLREARTRLASVAAAEAARPPRIEVLEQPFLPSEPDRPHYLRDALLAVAGSAALAALTLVPWLFLTRPVATHTVTGPTLVYAVAGGGASPALAPAAEPAQALAGDARASLPPAASVPRELGEAEARALLQAASPSGRLLITCLLSGVSPEEAQGLRWMDLDPGREALHLAGRELPLLAPLWQAFAALPEGEGPVWGDGRGGPARPEDLAALVACAAYDAALPAPDEVTPAALRHSYIAFLVRQGVRLSDLEALVGPLPPTALAAYGPLAAGAPRVELAQAERVHPALRTPG